MILPRADTPKAVVSYDKGRTYIEFRCRRGSPGPGGLNHIETRDGGELVSAEYENAYSPRRGYSTHVVIHGQAQQLQEGTIQFDLDVAADEPIRVAVEGLEIVEMTRGDKPLDESESLSGKFRVTIVGRVTKQHD